MELAYRLVDRRHSLVKSIRDHLIVSITPAADPDGRDRYVDWYYRYKIDETSEDDNMGGPPYWGKYIFHDDNRDINYSQLPMRNLLDWYLDWHPPIMHDLHESVPFLYTFSGQAPQEPDARSHPLWRAALVLQFRNGADDQVRHARRLDAWLRRYVVARLSGLHVVESQRHAAHVRNVRQRRREHHAPPHHQSGRRGGGGPARRPGHALLANGIVRLPPYAEVDWSMRNNTNYMETGVLSGMQLAAAFPQVVLENFYQKEPHSIESGKKEAPYGYVIPADQADHDARRVRRQNSAAARHRSRPRHGRNQAQGRHVSRGSLVIKRDQPYGRLAKILLEKQDYPDPNLRTYDDSGMDHGPDDARQDRRKRRSGGAGRPGCTVDKFEPKGTLNSVPAAVAYAVLGQRLGQSGDPALPAERRAGPNRRAGLSTGRSPAGSFIILRRRDLRS